MREGELIALTLDDFDFEKKEVSINKSLGKVEKKNYFFLQKQRELKELLLFQNFYTNRSKNLQKRDMIIIQMKDYSLLQNIIAIMK